MLCECQSGGFQTSRGESGRSEVLCEHQWKGAALAPAAAVTAASQCATDRSRSGSPKRPVERKASQQSMVLDVEIGGCLNSKGITENQSEHEWRISVRLERADDRSVWPCADVRSACQGAQLSCSNVRTFSTMCVLCSFCAAFFVLAVCDFVMIPIEFVLDWLLSAALCSLSGCAHRYCGFVWQRERQATVTSADRSSACLVCLMKRDPPAVEAAKCQKRME